MKKRIVSSLMALVMVFTLLPVGVIPAAAETPEPTLTSVHDILAAADAYSYTELNPYTYTGDRYRIKDNDVYYAIDPDDVGNGKAVFLIESAHRYDIKGRAYIETPKKYYFSDMGLRNARLNFRQFEQTHAMENVIYNELKMRGFNVDVGVVPIAERNEEGKVVRKQLELDFVCNLGSKRYYIQSAYSLPTAEKQEQEARPLRKIDDSFKKIIVTKDIVPAAYDENGVLTMNIYDFLLDSAALEK